MVVKYTCKDIDYHGYQAVAPLRQAFTLLKVKLFHLITTAIRPWLPCGLARKTREFFVLPHYHGYQAVAPLRRE